MGGKGGRGGGSEGINQFGRQYLAHISIHTQLLAQWFNLKKKLHVDLRLDLIEKLEFPRILSILPLCVLHNADVFFWEVYNKCTFQLWSFLPKVYQLFFPLKRHSLYDRAKAPFIPTGMLQEQKLSAQKYLQRKH